MGIKTGDKINYALDFSPLKNILDIPIKVGKAFLCVYPENGNYNDAQKFDNVNTDNPNLYEFVNYIIWELSFHGTPEDRDENLKEVRGRVDEFEKRTNEVDMAKEY